MCIIITNEEDIMLRRYALRLNREVGEDAYHVVVCDVLSKNHVDDIKNIPTFFRVSIRRALYKIFRHERAERKNIQAYINNDPVPMQIGLVWGRKKREVCLTGRHKLVDGNLSYIGKQRTCRMCKREREARDARARRGNI